MKLADVSSAGSFAVYLPRHGRDLEELNRGMMNFYARGRTEGAECIEQGSHYAYEDVDDVRIIRRYKRVRVNVSDLHLFLGGGLVCRPSSDCLFSTSQSRRTSRGWR